MATKETAQYIDLSTNWLYTVPEMLEEYNQLAKTMELFEETIPPFNQFVEEWIANCDLCHWYRFDFEFAIDGEWIHETVYDYDTDRAAEQIEEKYPGLGSYVYSKHHNNNQIGNKKMVLR